MGEDFLDIQYHIVNGNSNLTATTNHERVRRIKKNWTQYNEHPVTVQSPPSRTDDHWLETRVIPRQLDRCVSLAAKYVKIVN